MSRLILIQEDDYERQYRESMNYLNSKYHDQPTRLKNIPISDADTLESSTHGVFSRHNQQNSGTHRNTPIGKLVI
jgi:hypothetical protein